MESLKENLASYPQTSMLSSNEIFNSCSKIYVVKVNRKFVQEAKDNRIYLSKLWDKILLGNAIRNIKILNVKNIDKVVFCVNGYQLYEGFEFFTNSIFLYELLVYSDVYFLIHTTNQNDDFELEIEVEFLHLIDYKADNNNDVYQEYKDDMVMIYQGGVLVFENSHSFTGKIDIHKLCMNVLKRKVECHDFHCATQNIYSVIDFVKNNPSIKTSDFTISTKPLTIEMYVKPSYRKEFKEKIIPLLTREYKCKIAYYKDNYSIDEDETKKHIDNILDNIKKIREKASIPHEIEYIQIDENLYTTDHFLEIIGG